MITAGQAFSVMGISIILLGVAFLIHVRKEAKDAHGSRRN